MRIWNILLVLATVTPAALPSQAALEDSYFAPENQLLFRLVSDDGVIRQFERDFSRPGMLRSVEDWDGVFKPNGTVVLRHWENGAIVRSYQFDRGRLIGASEGTDVRTFEYGLHRNAPTNVVPPLALVDQAAETEQAQEYSERELSQKWIDSGRLSFPYVNPNLSGALYAELAILFFVLLLRKGGIGIRCFNGAAFAALSACLLWSGSRGAMLGFAAGLVLAAAVFLRGHPMSRKAWIALGCGLGVVLLALVVLSCTGNLTRGFASDGTLDWSNRIRMDMWKAAPRMMVDAAGGWDFMGVGKAYLNWYMPPNVFCLTGSLMNDHLTWLVGLGWFGRFLYLFLVFLALAVSGCLAWTRREPLAFAVFAAFMAMAWFNPVFSEVGLWAIPIVALGFAVWRFPWRELKITGGICLFSALASGAIVLAVRSIDLSSGTAGPAIVADGRRVLVNGRHPRVWVVDDCRGALGGALVGKDIRDFYSVVVHAPAIGYVTDIADVPERGVDRLVLAGKAGFDWLTMLSENPDARTRLPKSVLFISPPFSPSAVPEGVLKTCNPTVLVGEFAARFDSEYANPPSWVKIIPGMETYILRWLEYVFGG